MPGLSAMTGLGGLSGIFGGGAAFSPTDLPDLVFWTDASDPTTLFQDAAATTPAVNDGDPVGARLDKSGNDRHAAVTHNDYRPLLKTGANGINGQPIVRHDGINDRFALTLPASQAMTIVAVVRPISLDNHFYIAGQMGTDVNRGWQLYISTAGAITFTRYTGPATAFTLASPNGTVKEREVVRIEVRSVGGAHTMYKNGGVVDTDTNAGPYQESASVALLGAGFTTTNPNTFANGDHAVLIICNTILSDDDSAAIGTYLDALLPPYTPEAEPWLLPWGREDTSGVYAAGGKLYLFGGDDDALALDDILKIDTTTGVIEQITAVLPTGRFKAPAVWDDDAECAYIYGGRNSYLYTAYAGVLKFDPTTDTLATLTEVLPSASAEFAAVWDSTQKVAYLFGGYTGNNSNTLLTRILKHDPTAGTVTELDETLPVALASQAGAYVPSEQAIYLFGGFQNATESPRTVDTIYKFDCQTETISVVTETLPAIRDSAVAAYSANQHKIYIFGGYSGAGGEVGAVYYDSLLAFDVATETISTLSSTLAKATDDFPLGYDPVNDVIYLMGLLPAGAADNDVVKQRYFGKFTPPDTFEMLGGF